MEFRSEKAFVSFLRRHAKKAASFSRCPYSSFRVGAVVVTIDGKLALGANVENGSFGLTICAERSALFNSVLLGVCEVKAVAIYTETIRPTFPCGACRQVIRELAPSATVYMFCQSKTVETRTVGQLLPDAFVFA